MVASSVTNANAGHHVVPVPNDDPNKDTSFWLPSNSHPREFLRESLQFLAYSYKHSNSYTGTVCYTVTENKKVLSRQCIRVDKDRNITLYHDGIPDDGVITLHVGLNSQSAKQMYTGELNPITAVFAGTVSVPLWKINELKSFCLNIDFATDKWIEFYESRAEQVRVKRTDSNASLLDLAQRRPSELSLSSLGSSDELVATRDKACCDAALATALRQAVSISEEEAALLGVALQSCPVLQQKTLSMSNMSKTAEAVVLAATAAAANSAPSPPSRTSTPPRKPSLLPGALKLKDVLRDVCDNVVRESRLRDNPILQLATVANQGRSTSWTLSSTPRTPSHVYHPTMQDPSPQLIRIKAAVKEKTKSFLERHKSFFARDLARRAQEAPFSGLPTAECPPSPERTPSDRTPSSSPFLKGLVNAAPDDDWFGAPGRMNLLLG